ncbi:hypothetical protein LAZ67_18001025 [Cordylochernes scorpioides]|uniref:CCHC-type domain-containing protein n=1 Tax=Cordylochernes scorpioides TaxID=51811 RepID=A0ABY6LJM0_9ARAC|nr:hypothetical protein LAZ67_18001025 [Cordylochernes scorpioides]
MTLTLINTPLEKLNDQNYRSWKYNTKMMLIERELWKYVTEPAPDEEASRTIFNMKQEKVLAMIALTISPSQQIHIMDCTTAQEAWDTLEQVYEPKSRSRILQLNKQFISIRFEEQETMTNYLGRLKICSDHLREAGEEMQDQDLAYSMLAGLPESYDGIIMTFSNVEDKEFTSSKVKHVLLAEYEKRMARRVDSTNEALQFGTTTRKEDKKKKNFTCYKCGKEGHIARSCRGKAKTPAPNLQPLRCSTHEIAGSEMLTALSCAIPENSWVIDNGATHHVCNKREWFTNFQGITSDPILRASGTTRAEGCGDIKFKAYVGDMHANLAAERGDVTAPKTAATTSATPASPASLNWADSEMAEVDSNDGYTVVKSKKRRLTSTPENAARQPGRPAEKPSPQQRKRPTGPRAVLPQEIKATRANIADARARQATTNHENYVFVELCPEIPYYSYLKAMSALLGGQKTSHNSIE